MVNSVLPGHKSVTAESTVPRELGLGAYDTRILVVVCVDIWMDVAEVLYEMVLPEARLHVLHTIGSAQAADP